MKIKTPLFKRLVAMIMVIAMVAGYVSVPSFAAEEIPSGESQDTTTEVNAVGFNVVVTREEKIANEVFAEGQAEGEEPVAVYVYTAELKIGDEDKTADAVFTWPGQAEEDGTYVSENPTVALSVEFDGIKLPVTTADTDEEQTFTLAAETKGVELAYVGAAIATEACEIKEGANFVLIVPEKEEDPKATWQTVWNEENVDDVDGTPVANKAATDLELAKVLLYGESGTTCYLEIPVTAQTVKNTTPKITVSVVRGESEEAYAEETWYQKNDTFKVTFATVGAVVLDAKYLTQYIIHGEDKLDWERVGDDWVVSYKLTETTSFGRFNIGANSVVQNYPVKVDTTDAKDIEIVLNRAYYNDGMLHVFWDHKAGESGIKSVDVYVAKAHGEAYKQVGSWAPSDSRTHSVTVDQEYVGGCIYLLLQTNSGMTAESNHSKGQPALGITFAGPEGTVVAKNQSVTVTVSGANGKGIYKLNDAESKVVAKDTNGDPITATAWTYNAETNTWTCEVPLANGLNELSVTAVDQSNRVVSKNYDVQYTSDTEAPVITLTRDEVEVVPSQPDSETPAKEYAKSAKFVVNVTDNLPGFNFTITYTVNGKETTVSETLPFEIPLDDGDHLENIKVKAEDVSGNDAEAVYNFDLTIDKTAPEINVAISDNVTGFYKKDDSYFVVLDPAVALPDAAAADATVVLTVTVSDTSPLDTTGLEIAESEEDTGKWVISADGKTATKEFTVTVPVDETDTLSVSFPSIKDVVGNQQTAAVTVTPKAKNGEVVTAYNLVCDKGIYTGTLKIDRRTPSTGAIDAPPKVELKADVTPVITADGAELYKDTFNFTLSVNDGDEATNSGVASVKYKITDKKGAVAKTDGFVKVTANENVYTVKIEKAGVGESDEVELTVAVADHVGNTYTYVKTFHFDNQAPVITVEKQEENGSWTAFDLADADKADLGKDTVLRVTIKDMHLAENLVTLDGENVKCQPVDGGVAYLLTLTEETHTIVANATDLAGNVAAELKGEVVVDTKNPTVEIKIVPVAAYKNEDNGNEYHKEPVIVTVTFSDDRLKVSDINITLNGVALVKAGEVTEQGKNYNFTVPENIREDIINGSVVYMFEISEHGNYTIHAVDKDRFGHDGENTKAVHLDRKIVLSELSADGKSTPNVNGAPLFSENFTYTFDVLEDMSGIQSVVYTITDSTGVVKTAEGAPVEKNEEGKYSISIEGNGESGLVTLEVVATDNVGNKATKTVHFRFDNQKPVVEIKLRDGKQADGFYHNEAVVVDVTITDKYLAAELEKTSIKVNGEEVLTASDLGKFVTSVPKTLVFGGNDEKYKADGHYVISAYAEDRTPSVLDNSAEVDFYIDQTNPEITVTVDSSNYRNTYNGVDYYDGELTYTFTVTDQFLDAAGAAAPCANIIVTKQVGTETITEIIPLDNKTVDNKSALDEDKYIYTLTVTDGEMIKDIQIQAIDNAGNQNPVLVYDYTEGVAENQKRAGFTYDAEKACWDYTGNPMVVDSTDPVASLTFSENVEFLYINGTTVYVVLKAPVEGASGKKVTDSQDVTLTLTVTDKNLLIDNTEANAGYSVRTAVENVDWTGATPVNAESTVTLVVSGTAKADGTCVFELDATVFDLAGNVLKTFTSAPVNDAEQEGYQTALPVTVDENGHFAYTISVDRKRPGSTWNEEGVPTIEINPSIVPTKTYSGLDLFDGDFSFELKVTDGETGDENSGVKYVKWSIKDNAAEKVVTEYGKIVSGNDLDTNGVYKIDVKQAKKDVNGESNEVVLTIQVEDNVGNIVTYTKTFGFDTLAPRVNIELSGDEASNGYFHDGPVTAVVTIEDLNLSAELADDKFVTDILVNGESVLVEGDLVAGDTTNITKTIVFGKEDSAADICFAADDLYKIVAYAWDLTKGADEQGDSETFVMDQTDPEITVEKTQGAYVSETKTADFYNGEVTYTVTVKDQFLNAAQGGVAKLVITYLDGKTVTVDLTKNDISEVADRAETDWDTYQHEFIVKEADVVTGISLEVKDNAGNNSPVLTVNDNEKRTTFAYDKETAKFAYTGKQIVVDMTEADIQVEADTANYVQTYKDVNYFSGDVTYTFTVTDASLDLGDSSVARANVTVTYQGGKTENFNLELTTADNKLVTDSDVYTGKLTLTDGQMVEDIQIEVVDNAGHKKATLAVTDKKELTAFAYDEETAKWDYTGNPVVVDSTDPTATLKFSDNVESLYLKETENGTIVYVILTKPVKGESGVTPSLDGEVVSVTLTVKDMNLAIDNAEGIFSVKSNEAYGFDWKGETTVNADGTVTLTAFCDEVKPDGTCVFCLDVTVADLAGNVLKNFTSENTEDGKTALAVEIDENGHFVYTVSLDRMRSYSDINDKNAPVIEVTPSITPTTTAGTDPVDLFNGNFTFGLVVTDGENNENNSGVKYVKWSITDPNGVVKSYATDEKLTAGGKYIINVEQAGAAGESNEVELLVEAMDNSGNIIYYKKVFGFDTLAPRVTITQSNHDVRNGKYFRADQVVTVTITDLNFEPTTSTVDTEVAFGGWTAAGNNVYTTTLTYNVDGDYTFAMATTDRANNAAAIDYTTGLVSLQEFTIDKTAPVIRVTYNYEVPVDTNTEGVQFFDHDRIVTVTITEHNFRAADVVSNLGAANALSAFASYLDTHTATETFTEGNNYSVHVAYTDLAGNPAVSYTSPTFSVDLTPPTITMTSGSVQNKQAIAGDLVLGYTINDEQSNLKDYDVTLLYLGSGAAPAKEVKGAEYYTMSEHDGTTGYVNMTNIAAEKLNDGIYTLRITATDYAGHVVNLSPDLVFSLNRFGSTFMLYGEYTINFLTQDANGMIYRGAVENDLVIKEINPDGVWQDSGRTKKGSVITVSVNGIARELVEGVDYVLTTNDQNNGSEWYEYTYQIKPEVFYKDGKLVDGDYNIFFYSEDDALNKNTNEANEGSTLVLGADGTYSNKISFVLDATQPVISIVGVEAGKDYQVANREIEVSVSDNTPIAISVFVDGNLVETVEVADGQSVTSDWLYYDATSGTYKINLSQKNNRQDIRVVVADASGNTSESVVEGVLVTENLFYLYIHNPIALIITGVLLVALIILIIIARRSKKSKNQK